MKHFLQSFTAITDSITQNLNKKIKSTKELYQKDGIEGVLEATSQKIDSITEHSEEYLTNLVKKNSVIIQDAPTESFSDKAAIATAVAINTAKIISNDLTQMITPIFRSNETNTPSATIAITRISDEEYVDLNNTPFDFILTHLPPHLSYFHDKSITSITKNSCVVKTRASHTDDSILINGAINLMQQIIYLSPSEHESFLSDNGSNNSILLFNRSIAELSKINKLYKTKAESETSAPIMKKSKRIDIN